MAMNNPPQSGEIIRDACLEPLGLSVTAAEKWLGVSRHSLSERLNRRASVSAEMAIRLEKAGWSVAEAWLRNQVSYDLWQARQRADEIKSEKYPTVETAA